MPPARIGTRFLDPAREHVPLRRRLARTVSYFLPPVVMDGLRLARRIGSSS